MNYKIAYICNPAAGRGEAPLHYKTFLSMLSPKIVCRSFETRVKGASLVKDIAEMGFGAIIIAGGDGTVHEVINELAPGGGDLEIGIIPVGTGNDLARSLMDYSAFVKDSRSFLSGLAGAITRKTVKTKKVPVFSVNDRVFFSCYMGIGFDGQVINTFHRYRNFPLPNRFLYFCSIVKALAERRRVLVSFQERTGDEQGGGFAERDLFQLLLLNTSSYAGGLIQVGPTRGRGSFELRSICNAWEFLEFFVKNSALEYIRKMSFGGEPLISEADSLSLEIQEETFVQIDGEDYSELFGKRGVISVRKAGEIRLIHQ